MGSEWVALGLAVAALLASVGAAAVGASRRRNVFQDAMQAAWLEMASALGARVEVSSRGAVTPRVLTLLAELDGVEVTATLVVPVASGPELHTTVHARYVLGVGPPLASLADAAALGAEVRSLAEAVGRELAVHADGERVTLVRDGAETRASALQPVLRLAAAIARAEAAHLRELSTIDGAEHDSPAEAVPRVRVRRGLAVVELLVRREDGTAAHEARTPARPGFPRFTVDVHGPAAAAALPDGVLEAGLAASLERCAPAVLASDGERLAIVWSARPSLEQAGAAVRVLAALGAPVGARGAFR